MGTFGKKKVLGITAVAAAVAAAITPMAQAEDLAEIVVTARKRDESFKDVPMTVSVFTERAIEQAGIQRPADFIAMVPNMTLVETQNAGNAFVVVRGVSQARNSEPSVAVIVDGVLESNPAEFNQELFDISQIEVLKGPQGALYGRNAIGGAIIITTKNPADKLEGGFKLGYGNGSSKRGQVSLSGPVGQSDAWKFRASFNAFDTDGFLDNEYLKQKADPARDYSGRLRLNYDGGEAFKADLRLSASRLETRSLYFVIPRDVEANPFSSFTTPPNANNVTAPIQSDNPGENNRDLLNLSAKLDFAAGEGTVTSVSAYGSTREVLTGDAYDFRPAANSVFKALYGTDFNQSQFLDIQSFSEELRYTSAKSDVVNWIAGAYYIHTQRFISTGNLVDTGAGVFPVYRAPRAGGNNPSATFLADSQSNNAWAVFADATWTLSPTVELDTAFRYDEDTRENTTKTPTAFLPDPSARSGEVRKHTWSQLQPKGTLRWKPADNVTVFGGWSRGFRSGGFNQTGVGAVARANGVLGVNDLFNAEVADTWEAGIKSQWADRRVTANLSAYRTKSTNGYFFVFLAANSTQNLGNVDATYKGLELELSARPADGLELFANFGYTDSEITGMADRTVVGNQAPLVSRLTFNLGGQWRHPVGEGMDGLLRLEYQNIGRTWWEPYNTTSRDPVSLVNLRAGVEGKNWAVTAWSKNLADEKYNAEFSPGGFLWKALPRRFGIEYSYKF